MRAPGQHGSRGGELVAGVVGIFQGLGAIMWDHKGTLWGPGGHQGSRNLGGVQKTLCGSTGHLGVFEGRWHQRDMVATRVCSGDPGTDHSPQLVHLILQRLRLLGQTGQRLVPLLQLRDLPLQLGTVQALVFPAVLQPGGVG